MKRELPRCFRSSPTVAGSSLMVSPGKLHLAPGPCASTGRIHLSPRSAPPRLHSPSTHRQQHRQYRRNCVREIAYVFRFLPLALPRGRSSLCPGAGPPTDQPALHFGAGPPSYDCWIDVDTLMKDLGDNFAEVWLAMWAKWFHAAHLKLKRVRTGAGLELYTHEGTQTTLMGAQLPTIPSLLS
jgi:hypothetical protein